MKVKHWKKNWAFSAKKKRKKVKKQAKNLKLQPQSTFVNKNEDENIFAYKKAKMKYQKCVLMKIIFINKIRAFDLRFFWTKMRIINFLQIEKKREKMWKKINNNNNKPVT